MGIVSGIVASSGGTDVSDATTKAYDIKTGKTAYIATGSATGTGYFPAMMQYNGTTGYYNKTQAVSGNKFTCLVRLKMSSKAGSSEQNLVFVAGTGGTRAGIAIGDASNADTYYRNRARCATQNTGGTNICRLYSNVDIADGEPHTILFSFDGDAGVATLVVDGVNAINTAATNHNPATAGTVVNASSTFGFGATALGVGPYAGSIGFCGYRDAYLTNWSDFMQTDGTPKQLDETTWAEWSGGSVTSPLGRPLFWHESGKMDENKGSAGAMTANGTIILAAASTWS